MVEGIVFWDCGERASNESQSSLADNEDAVRTTRRSIRRQSRPIMTDMAITPPNHDRPCPFPWSPQSFDHWVGTAIGFVWSYRPPISTRTHARTHARTHTHVRTHARTNTHTHTHAHIHIYTHTYTRARMHARTNSHTHTCTHAYTHEHTDTHTRTHEHTHTQTHTHTHTNTHTHSYHLSPFPPRQ